MHRIDAVILDWAGTAVDYGCFAPVNAIIAAFAAFGVEAGIEETRAQMGLAKRKHIEKMLDCPELAARWVAANGHPHTREDIDRVYAYFEPALFATLKNHADPVPGALEAVARIREMRIAIGSTTGYTKKMMDVVAPIAKKKGYAPDCLVCPEETGGMGRPFPYMLWRNLEKLGIPSIRDVLKVGDTTADMQEGQNAGCLCVGVLKGSSMLGLSMDEVSSMDEDDLATLLETAKRKYLDAGANYVINDIGELPALVEKINGKSGKRIAA